MAAFGGLVAVALLVDQRELFGVIAKKVGGAPSSPGSAGPPASSPPPEPSSSPPSSSGNDPTGGGLFPQGDAFSFTFPEPQPRLR
jgi:hypothetical protein